MRDGIEGDYWPDWLCRGLGGLDAAVFASLPLLGWFCVLGILNDRHWWAGFNFAAWPFFGDRVFSMGLSAATLAGASFLLFLYGSLGFLMGLWFRPDTAWGVLARGLILGLAWHFFADRWFWNWVSPYAGSYFAARLMLPGHLLWAIFLLRYQSRYESVARTFGDPARWPAPAPLAESEQLTTELPTPLDSGMQTPETLQVEPDPNRPAESPPADHLRPLD